MSTCNMLPVHRKSSIFAQNAVVEKGLDVNLSITGCLGMCFAEPQVQDS